jgi:hypothetical protein
MESNQREVSKEEFFSALNKDPRDIMPNIVGEYPYQSVWRDKTGRVFGTSRSGGYFLEA